MNIDCSTALTAQHAACPLQQHARSAACQVSRMPGQPHARSAACQVSSMTAGAAADGVRQSEMSCSTSCATLAVHHMSCFKSVALLAYSQSWTCRHRAHPDLSGRYLSTNASHFALLQVCCSSSAVQHQQWLPVSQDQQHCAGKCGNSSTNGGAGQVSGGVQHIQA